MNLSDRLESFLTVESLALIRLIKTEAERLDLPLYIVGGSVRDLMLGRVINDFDLTVEGDAAQLVESILRKYAGKVVFHARFGTATWTLDETTFKRLNVPMLGPSEFPSFLDFISARSETYSQPGALPSVNRSTIDDDLRRRDFTINAMAIRLDGMKYGQLYDPLGGQADLERRLIQILHARSFMDDPTRMLRAVRYAGRYGFEIEPETLSLINDEAREVLSSLSGERLRHEFDLIFEEQDPSRILNRFAELDLLRPIRPLLPLANSQLPTLETPISEFGSFIVPDSLSVRQTLGWTLWLMPLSVSEIEALAKRMDFPAPLTKSARAASSLFGALPSFTNWQPSQWTFYLDELPALAVYAVYLVTREQALREYLVTWQNIKPTINGNDLKERGLEPGPRYAEILRQLRAAWLDGEVKTQEQEKLFLDKLFQ
jgi:tRNA nucleotidyltransferase (CCA-adding enzyme)